MGRAPCCDKNGLKKGPWTPEEDLKLTDYIKKHGPGNWRNLPKNAGLERCGKSCRLRWTNYLRPDIKRGRFSFEEEETIIQLHSVLGNKWSAIAARLPGRTDNEIKNYWNTHIRKRLLRMGIDPVTHSPRLDILDLSSVLGSSLCNNQSILNLSSLLSTQPLFNPQLLRLASTILSLNNINNRQENNAGIINPVELFSQNILQGNQLLPDLIQPNNNPINVNNNNNNNNNSGFTSMITTQAMQAPNNILDHDQYLGLSSNNLANVNVQENFVVNDNITIPSSLEETLVSDLPESSYFQSLLDYGNRDLGFESVLSTPSSSTTPLNSCSTNEDERESYCSSLLKFQIPDSTLDISDFL